MKKEPTLPAQKKSDELKLAECNNGLTKTLSPTSRKILAARNDRKEYSQKDFVLFIGEMHTILSIKELPHGVITNELFEVAKDKFQEMSLGDMKLAFRMNQIQEFGEYIDHYQIFDLKFFSKVLLAYRVSRGKALKEQSEKLEVYKEPIMTEEEAEYEYHQTLKRQFATYKETGILAVFMPVKLYGEFERKGLIQLTLEEKRAIYKQAEEKYASGLKIARLNPKNKGHLNELSNTINRLETNTANSTDQQRVKSVACEIAIKKYYDTITELNF